MWGGFLCHMMVLPASPAYGIVHTIGTYSTYIHSSTYIVHSSNSSTTM